jgi:AcrR family transcriptional regulator
MIAQVGLRERKKARTRASIREHAIRLFREQGYQATTVEQIASAAEVSPSTFFRYFPTKEDVVLQDDMDVRMLEALDRQPADLVPLQAVRAAVREAWTSFTPAEWELIREGGRLSVEVPEIRARAMSEFARTIDSISDGLARRFSREAAGCQGPSSLRVRVLAGAVVGVMMAVFLPEHFDPEAGDGSGSYLGPAGIKRIDEALELLAAGLPL